MIVFKSRRVGGIEKPALIEKVIWVSGRRQKVRAVEADANRTWSDRIRVSAGFGFEAASHD
jgi:hypothetical protein